MFIDKLDANEPAAGRGMWKVDEVKQGLRLRMAVWQGWNEVGWL